MILIFSDIHADREAAHFIESIASDFDEIYCCGDVCGYGRDFRYVIDMFKNLNIRSVLGNHDYAILHPMGLIDYPERVVEPILWTIERMNSEEMDYIESLPLQIDTDSGICIRHTVPDDGYVHSIEDCKPLLSLTDKKIICIGHTHMYEEFKVGDKLIVNAGSISKGRGNSSPGYLVIDNGTVEHRLRKEV